jgi:hypothetical protein
MVAKPASIVNSGLVNKNHTNNYVTHFYITMAITWSLATIMGDNKINNARRCRKIAGNFNHHGDALVKSGEHCIMKHIKGFTRSQWMPPSGKCLRRIALAATMVAILVENTKH